MRETLRNLQGTYSLDPGDEGAEAPRPRLSLMHKGKVQGNTSASAIENICPAWCNLSTHTHTTRQAFTYILEIWTV